MRVRQVLATMVAGGVLLLGVGATPAGAAPIQVYGRNAPTYTSYPNDPTPTSKWLASAQGEGLSNGVVTTHLRGRAAVQETFGIRRARIYEVALQRLVNGRWETVAVRTADVINEASRAYAVAYTPARPIASDPGTRTYRVRNSHGIRRDDGVVANRTTYSRNFAGPLLEDDPQVVVGRFSASIERLPSTWKRGDHSFAIFRVRYDSPFDQPAQGVEVDIKLAGGMAIDEGSGSGNDFHRGTWVDGMTNEVVWTVFSSTVGPQSVELKVTSTTPRVEGATVRVDMESTPSDGPVVDTEVDVRAIGPPHTIDRDPSTAEIEVHRRDLVTIAYDIRNEGPDTATETVLDGGWPFALDDDIQSRYADTGADAGCHIFSASTRRLVCELEDMPPGPASHRTIYVQGRVSDVWIEVGDTLRVGEGTTVRTAEQDTGIVDFGLNVAFPVIG